MKRKITIFTPTYNRAESLETCFESLLKQTCKEFNWLIVDDGSIDKTEQEVERWISRADFKIDYIKTNNRGKHSAHNIAVKNCQTDYIATLDSDDCLKEYAVSVLLKEISKIDRDESTAGIIGTWVNVKEKDKSKNIKESISYTTGAELYQKHGFTGETFRLYKINILKKYKYPIFEGEKFMSENVLYDQIDKRYKLRVVHYSLSYGAYHDDGLSKSINMFRSRSPRGYALSLASSAFHSVSFSARLKYTILYIMWCNYHNLQNDYKAFGYKLHYLSMYPLALLMKLLKRPRFFFKGLEQSK